MNIGVNTRMLIKGRMEGIARYTYETTRRIVKSHPEHQFFFFFDRAYDSSFIFEKNVTPIVLTPPARHPILWYFYFEYSIPRALEKYKIDVFYSPDNYLSLRSSVPTLLVTHDIAYAHYPDHIPALPRKYYQRYIPLYNHRADHIIAVSQATKSDLVTTYGLQANKITVAHNSCPAGFSKASPEQKLALRSKYSMGKPYIIYAGAVHPRKNVTSVIRAFDLYKEDNNTDIQLVIAGRWAWNADDTRQVLDRATHKKDIHLETRPDMREIICGADAALYISLYEGFGIPILEAMSAEVPVITSNISSMPEVAGDAAILVDPLDVGQTAKAIDRVLKDHSLSEDLKKKGRAQVASFSWDTTSVKIYEHLVAITK